MAAQLRDAANASCRVGFAASLERVATTRLPRHIAERPYCEPSLTHADVLLVLVQIASASAYWMHYHAYMTAATHMHASTLARVTVAINTAKLQLCVLKQSSRLYTEDLKPGSQYDAGTSVAPRALGYCWNSLNSIPAIHTQHTHTHTHMNTHEHTHNDYHMPSDLSPVRHKNNPCTIKKIMFTIFKCVCP